MTQPRITWTAARDAEAHARIAGRPRTLCGIRPVEPRFAWPETQPRCEVCLSAAKEVARVLR